MRYFISLLLVASLSACSQTTPPLKAPTLEHFYSYQIYTPSGEALSLRQLASQLNHYDVILIGEWHTHAAIHLFQAQLLHRLYRQNPAISLSMEQISREHQALLDQYLNGKIGEQYFIKSSQAWPNYETSYRPLVEFAKQQQLSVIAANAPQSIVRCISKQGVEYLEKLSNEERAWVAKEINTAPSLYKEKFMASMHHGELDQTERHYAAQITWDETMAESIVQHRARHPNNQVLHIAGKFHTEGGLGIAAAILRRDPMVKVAVITPVHQLTRKGSDYQLFVSPLPPRYLVPEHQQQAYQTLKKRKNIAACLQ